MSTTEPSSTTSRVKLYYYFWLPAGIDEFELDSDSDRHFENTAKYRVRIEGSIAQRLKNAISDNFPEGFRFDEGPSNLRVRDGGLGLRKLEFRFRYDPDPASQESQIHRLTNQLSGRAVILSNGLYLWCFDIDYPSSRTLQEILQSARNFLCADFVKRHIAKLFEFEWDEEGKDKPLDQYAGVLTYYQIDLLFNGIFDKDAHPVNFMTTSLDDNVPNSSKAHYKVGGIIKSLSRFAIGGYHFSLFDDFKEGSRGGDSIDFDKSRFFTDTELFGTAWERPAEEVVSRTTYAGMEQFLRKAISSSLLHYKAGLDHCRTQLTNDSLLIRINKTAGELRRESLAPELSSADLQAYTSIVAGKLPAFQFLYGMINEVERVTRPIEARNSNRLDDPSWAEWVYGQFMLHNTLLHYQLYVTSIKNDVDEISRSLEIGRTDEVITELTDTRKLTEIASETVNRTIPEGNRRQLEMLMVNLTQLALIFSVILAVAQIYVALGIWFMERLFPDGNNSNGNAPVSTPDGNAPVSTPGNILIAIGIWLVGLMLIWVIYKVLPMLVLRDKADGKRKGSKPDKSRDDANSSIETHTFGCSFFHEKLTHNHSSVEMIEDLAQRMPGIGRDEEVSRCASRSSFRETPLSAVERKKYTLESRDSLKGNGSYVFHIEVDRRMGRTEEYLREVRLVIKMPVGIQYSVDECAQRIIYDCLSLFHFDDPSRVMELLDQQFHGAKLATEQAVRRADGRAAVRKYEDDAGALTPEELERADKILDKLGVSPTGGILVYNTDALLASGSDYRTLWAVHRRILERAGQVVIPRGRKGGDGSQRWLDHLLRGCVIKSLDEDAQHEAIRLCCKSETDDVVEAHVVLTALRDRAAVLILHSAALERLEWLAEKAEKAQLRMYAIVKDQPDS